MVTRAGDLVATCWHGFLAPKFQLLFHAVGTLIWAALFVPGMTSWRDAVPFVVFCSIYANLVGHLSGLTASVGARKADSQDPM